MILSRKVLWVQVTKMMLPALSRAKTEVYLLPSSLTICTCVTGNYNSSLLPSHFPLLKLYCAIRPERYPTTMLLSPRSTADGTWLSFTLTALVMAS